MPHRKSFSKRKAYQAAALAGSDATTEAVAQFYVNPTLAKYFGCSFEASFLKQLGDLAQPVADKMPTGISVPSDNDKKVVCIAGEKIKNTKLTWGLVFVIGLSLISGFGYSSSVHSLVGIAFLFPFAGPGIFAYLMGSAFGSELARSSEEYRAAIPVAAKALAYERGKAEYWKNLDWRELELRVAALFNRMGYSAHATPASGDKGVDVVATRPQERLVIQCKQYSKPAQRNLVSELLGVMVAEKANRAILLCTGGFTKGAEDYAQEHALTLWDLEDLVRHNQIHNL